jgi:hypothetical protein
MENKEIEFHELYKKYYEYVLKYEVGDEDLPLDKLPHFCSEPDFLQELKDEGISIKVYMGY